MSLLLFARVPASASRRKLLCRMWRFLRVTIGPEGYCIESGRGMNMSNIFASFSSTKLDLRSHHVRSDWRGRCSKIETSWRAHVDSRRACQSANATFLLTFTLPRPAYIDSDLTSSDSTPIKQAFNISSRSQQTEWRQRSRRSQWQHRHHPVKARTTDLMSRTLNRNHSRLIPQHSQSPSRSRKSR